MCFVKKVVGLDIADGSIEVAEVHASFGSIKVKKINRVVLEKGIVQRGRILDSVKLSDALQTVFKTAKPGGIKVGKVFFALPESQVYLKHLELSTLEKKNKNEFIKNSLLENFPITDNDLVFSFRVLNQDKEKENILAVACSKKVLLEWSDFFKKNKLKLDFFDIEILAIYRDLFDKENSSSVCIVDMGAHASLVSIFDGRDLKTEFLINKAGDDLTSVVAEEMEIAFEKAEEEKIKNGLKGRSKKVSTILEREIKKVILDIKESLVDYNKTSGKKVEQIILVGGTSQMIGLQEFFEKELGVTVKIGSSKALNNKIPLLYIEAIGLALRTLDNRWDNNGPVFYNNY